MSLPAPTAGGGGQGAMAVFRNRPFLLLWLAQAATQIGGNMVLYGLTVIVSSRGPNSLVSILILTFLVPAVLFSALAGVYVDRMDRRHVLIATNLVRGLAFVALFLVTDNLALILILNMFVSTVNVFFTPAEASMIPILVPRSQLITANGIFTLTLNAAFALGFALIGPFVVAIAGPEALILLVAVLFFIAAVLTITLPSAPPVVELHPGEAVADAERAIESTVSQLREGLSYIRSNPGISWSLVYLGIAASLVGVLGVLGPDFARTTLGLRTQDFVVIVLPLGAGLVTGILLLNAYGRFLPRRRVIESGLIALGVLLSLLSVAGPLSRFLQRAEQSSGLLDLSTITSLLSVVVVIAFLAGIAYALVAIPAQTQLQEEIPEDARGRIFGILNMLVSVSSFLPIIIVGPISDLVGTTIVILTVALLIGASGVASVVRRGPLRPSESRTTAEAALIGVIEHEPPRRTPRRGPRHAAAPGGPTLWEDGDADDGTEGGADDGTDVAAEDVPSGNEEPRASDEPR